MTSIVEQTIHDQYAYWLKAPAPRETARSDAPIAVIGCGTSYNLALTVAAMMCEQGLTAVGVPGNEWLKRPQNYVPDWRKAVVVGLSRSGESTETVAAVRQSRAAGLKVVGITCEVDSSLAHAADQVIYAETDAAEGIVMTTSASLMLLNGLRYGHVNVDVAAAVNAGRQLAAEIDRHAAELVRGIRHVVYLAGGAAYGIAIEGGLKLQEMSQVFTQAYHPLEYRHGPISLVDDGTLAVMLYSTDSLDEESQVARDIQRHGARVLGFGGPGDVSLPLALTSGTRLLALLPPLQLLGERMALSRSLDTSAPRHLTKVVRLPDVA
ncbi:MAG: SIS domain-containing protein [Devosia sp.]